MGAGVVVSRANHPYNNVHVAYASDGCSFHFSNVDYPVSVYAGALHIPSYYTQDSSGAWRDDMGKEVARVRVNFAGKYYLGLHMARPDSSLLVARYRIDGSADRPSECRERVFVLSDDGSKVRPITRTAAGCN